MQTGAITAYIDVAQIALYAFWIFFAGLIYYLHRENKREGYPLESDRSAHVKVQGWPAMPSPKVYRLASGETVSAPRASAPEAVTNAAPSGSWLGAPLVPVRDPMGAGVGPGSYAPRADRVDRTAEGDARIVPVRTLSGFEVAHEDPDPRGTPVTGADGKVGGKVVDLWVDRSEMIFRYLEVEVAGSGAAKRVLLPVNFARISWTGVHVKSVLGSQLAGVPATRVADQVTLLEEERIMAYFGSGTLYAEPSRQEPLF